MPSSPSITAQIADLLGDDPRNPRPARPTVSEAAGHISAAQPVAAARENGVDLAVYRLEDGAIYQVEDRCPHDAGLLSDGFVDAGALVCRRHGWEFDGKSGLCRGRQASICPRRVSAPPAYLDRSSRVR